MPIRRRKKCSRLVFKRCLDDWRAPYDDVWALEGQMRGRVVWIRVAAVKMAQTKLLPILISQDLSIIMNRDDLNVIYIYISFYIKIVVVVVLFVYNFKNSVLSSFVILISLRYLFPIFYSIIYIFTIMMLYIPFLYNEFLLYIYFYYI